MNLEAGCELTKAIIAPEQGAALTSNLALTNPITEDIGFVLLGGFRQQVDVGMTRRCFDDVIVKSSVGCP